MVVVFGSQAALDTQKQATQTLKQNMQAGDATFLYVDTDKLDPNSDLGRVARRSAEQGLGLGPTGKSDMVFTGIYNVEQQANGQLGLGNSTATFWGGRGAISAIMQEQMQYAKKSTLRLPSDVPPPAPPQDGRTPDRPVPDQPHPTPDQPQPPNQPRPDQPQNDRPQDSKTDEQRKQEEERKREAEEKRKKEEEEKKQEEQRKSEELKKQEQEREERRKTIAGAKEYSLDQYADGWGKFLDRAEVKDGPVRDLVNEFGREMITGQVDGKKLSGLMDQVGATNQQAIKDSLNQLSQQLAQNGLRFSFDLDAQGNLAGIEMSDLVESGAKTSVKVSAAGNVVSQEQVMGDGSQPRPLSIDETTLRLAKKAEPAACP